MIITNANIYSRFFYDSWDVSVFQHGTWIEFVIFRGHDFQLELLETPPQNIVLFLSSLPGAFYR